MDPTIPIPLIIFGIMFGIIFVFAIFCCRCHHITPVEDTLRAHGIDPNLARAGVPVIIVYPHQQKMNPPYTAAPPPYY
ncbi:unnamed protein product [Adineta steineri]|uniref:Uncharacterized protein n=1 Tax=Adineta steineri TaxID=433720 RepID=A0A819F7B9_9BILA|nr:unnamed protein product [Adineta steineri]CAF3863122.1 unnamed protein product [Adineta steineri]